MKRLDDSTLEAIAEAICGQGEGAGGGYTAPGPYRTKTQICDFFRQADVEPQGLQAPGGEGLSFYARLASSRLLRRELARCCS
jgi:hypothetical protein